VYSRDLEWLPDGSEYPEETSCRFACGQHDLQEVDEDGKILVDDDGDKVQLGPVYKDILLAKMTPGQARSFPSPFALFFLSPRASSLCGMGLIATSCGAAGDRVRGSLY
jgi:hypothetical protein